MLVPRPALARLIPLLLAFLAGHLVLSALERRFSSPRPDTHGATASEVCSADDLARGTWTDGPVLHTEQDIRRAYNYSADATLTCELDSDHLGFRPGRVAAPRLVPRRECRVWPLDREGFARRALRSRGGIVFVGDSLMEDQALSLISFLHHQTPAAPPMFIREAFKLYIHPSHPLAASASAARTRCPVFSFYRTNEVLTTDELARAMAHAGERHEYRPRPGGQADADWYDKVSDAVGPLAGAKGTVEAGEEEEEEGEKGEEEEEATVLLVNFGAHWHPGVLGGRLREDDLWLGYKNALEILDAKVQSLPFRVSFFFRTMAPGQIDCHELSHFDNERQTFLSPLDPVNHRPHNYAQFEYMNALIHAHLASSSASYTIVDVWPMSVKRPEAHRAPPQDCLHWCLPGVQDWWNVLFWHQVILDSKWHDYHG